MPLIEKRYAEALIDVAAQKDEVDVFRQDLLTVASVFEENRDLRLLLLNPCVGNKIKKDIALRIFSNSVRPEISSLFMLLLDKRRIRCLPGILREYVKLADRKLNILSLRIIASAVIDQELLDKIGEKFRKKYNASSVRGEFRVDAQLIGGVKVIVGDRLTDRSVKGKLESLLESLKSVQS